MKVKMTETALGSPNGILVQKYNKGEVYDLGDGLYDSFVNKQKIANPVIKKAPAPVNKKAPAPDNKSIPKKG